LQHDSLSVKRMQLTVGLSKYRCCVVCTLNCYHWYWLVLQNRFISLRPSSSPSISAVFEWGRLSGARHGNTRLSFTCRT